MEEGHGNLYKWDLKLKKLCISKWGNRSKTFPTLLTADFSRWRYFQVEEKSKWHLFLQTNFLCRKLFSSACTVFWIVERRFFFFFFSAQHQVTISHSAFKLTQLQLLPFETEVFVNTAKFKKMWRCKTYQPVKVIWSRLTNLPLTVLHMHCVPPPTASLRFVRNYFMKFGLCYPRSSAVWVHIPSKVSAHRSSHYCSEGTGVIMCEISFDKVW